MKRINEFLLLLLVLIISLSVKAGDFVKTKDGVIVHPDASFSGNAKDVQLKVIAGNIIRVIAVASVIAKDRSMECCNRENSILFG